jgi:hypothetical protein
MAQMSLGSATKSNSLVVLLKIDFTKIVLLHQLDQTAEKIEIEDIFNFGSRIRFFLGFRHRMAFPTSSVFWGKLVDKCTIYTPA